MSKGTLIEVWTRRNPQETWQVGKPRCIFAGIVPAVPRVGEVIAIKEDGAAEYVREVLHDFTNGKIMITIDSCDPNHAYDG